MDLLAVVADDLLHAVGDPGLAHQRLEGGEIVVDLEDVPARFEDDGLADAAEAEVGDVGPQGIGDGFAVEDLPQAPLAGGLRVLGVVLGQLGEVLSGQRPAAQVLELPPAPRSRSAWVVRARTRMWLTHISPSRFSCIRIR